MRWVPAYFPFTHPSFELEIYFQDRWMEMLGCGIIHRDLMNNCKVYNKLL
jgi:phenylalanyl-tRNA synthetase alpha chain